jgi:para-nitrobenzyl esterase
MTEVDEVGLLQRWQRVLPEELVPDLIENCRKALAEGGKAVSVAEIALALQTDAQFRIPAIRLIEAQHSNNMPAYTYLFTWKSPVPDLGACHFLDVGFVFGKLVAAFNGTGPAADRLTRNIQDAWLAFARTGDPSCESLGNWPQYGSRRETMILGEKCHVAEAPYEDERRAWDPIPNAFLG